MKKLTLLSLVAASVLFTACGEEIKEAAKGVADSAVDATKEVANTAVETAKEAATTAVEKTVDTAKAAVTGTADAVADTAAAATGGNAKGQELYTAKCASCHGADGKTLAMGKSAKVAGQSVDALVESMNGYKAGTKNVAGMGMIMKGQAASLSDEEIKAVSEYMAGL